MLKIGIVGTGGTIGIAGMHIKAFKRIKEVEITALYDILQGRAAGYAEKFELGGAKICGSYEELLALTDAVVICTPNYTHTELCVQAFKAGKHVLCEKPFSTGAEAALPAVQYAELSQRVNMIGLCYRGIPALSYIKKLIDDGALGEIYYLRQSQGGNRIANPDVKLEWRMQADLSGPGAIADFGSHMLDIADWMLRGECGPIREVQSMKHTFVKHRDAIGSGKPARVTNDDVAVWNGRCENGTLLSFTSSRIGCATTLEVCGSGGYIFYDAVKPFQIVMQKKDLNGGYTGTPETLEVPETLYMEDPQTPRIPMEINFYVQSKRFVRAILDGAGYETDLRRGLYIQKLIDCVALSAESGKIVPTDFDD